MTLISRLWEDEKLPIKDGLYFADGKSFSIKLKFNGSMRIESINEFDLEALYMCDPEWITNIDITKIERLQNGYYFCCGEGANGSEGFFALLNSGKKLLWVAYFEELNPFCDFVVRENAVIIKSTSGATIDLDLCNPKAMAIISEVAL